MYLTQPYFLDDTPNQILHILSTIVVENFYTTIGQYPTLYDFLAIAPKEIFHWNYYLSYPSKSANVTSSLSAEELSKIPSNHEEKMWLFTCTNSW